MACLLLVAALVAGCTSAPDARWSGPREPGAPLVWGPCRDIRQVRNATVECSTLTVPADWSQPGSGQMLHIALIRARVAGQRDRIGSLVINPGGPGASGVDYAAYFASAAPEELLRRFDIVGFDPRGVGRSSPVTCLPDRFKDESAAAEPDPVTQAQFDEAVLMARQVARLCAPVAGRRYSTRQTVYDVEAIRAALGDEKLTYLGYSYGTLLGAVYAHQYPSRVRAAVLDGAVDPGQDFVTASEGQAAGFERAFTNFAAWCTETAVSCPIGPDAKAATIALMDSARRKPSAHQGRQATAGWILLAVLASLYQRADWPILARALADLRAGDPARLFRIADTFYSRDPSGRYTNLIDANLAINCTDEGQSSTVEDIRRLQGSWRAKYPLFGANLAVSLLPCALWGPGRDPYEAGPAAGAPPILVIGTKGDPATPYEQTASLAALLGTGRVLTWEGEGHTAYPETACVNDTVHQYLIDLTAPASGRSCPAR
ncbi:alpha/beta hydrolase [Longispora albida]|uniref:alpha/beta hydrolase n=1 Tax=Longispora albida TaxID=203523 RepID=UPI00036A21D8|nr:alpha/beta hydrolase [Longispora albida]